MAKKVKRPRARTKSATTKGLRCRIRMYRQGFGDCFLLSFTTDGRSRHIMIDCGLVTKATNGKQKIQSVLDDIIRETSGAIDLLVVTHEHWDHVSGFHYFQNYFTGNRPRLKVGHVWLAWTEKPGDALANQIAEKRDRASMALIAAEQRLAATTGADESDELARVGGFGAFSKNSDAAMDFVHQLGVDLGKIDYLEPGELRPVPDVKGVRTYVLGPPRSDKLLRVTNPRAGEGYADFGASAFMAAVDPSPPSATFSHVYGEQQFPLDPKLRLTKEKEQSQQLKPGDDAGVTSLVDAYCNAKSAWRKIDDDWLRFADSLSLQMNSYTNNTSLVLAFELIESGRVLLFAADAQVGNWMSWWGFEPGQRADGKEAPTGKPLRWRLSSGQSSLLDRNGDGYVDIEDLFRETVLYKVGHHGSHNGTLGLYGLDRLGRPDLVAMMPTNEKDAKASGWPDIPDQTLFTKIGAATQGRVLTSDEAMGVSPSVSVPPGTQGGGANATWKAFRSRTKFGPTDALLGGPLFVEYELQ